jgi:hypothetical protein
MRDPLIPEKIARKLRIDIFEEKRQDQCFKQLGQFTWEEPNFLKDYTNQEPNDRNTDKRKNNFIVIISDSRRSPPLPGSKEDFGHLSNNLK